MIDLFTIPDFLDPAARDELLAELERSSGSAATVLSQEAGGRVSPMVRRATRVSVSPETKARIKQLLTDRMPEIAAHFKASISTPEDPQFLRYETGDYFVAHQDGNTPMIHDESRFRRISAVIFLSERSQAEREGTYGGGELVFHGPYTGPMLRVPAPAEPGSMVAFRSETTHEVTPVTHGVRYTVAVFFRV